MKDYIKEKLIKKALDKQSLEKYFKVIEYFEKNPIKHKYYQWHHIYPSFLYREELGAKNRGYTIEKLDKDFPPEDNVIKLDTQYHVIAHYYLAKALQTKDSENAFRIFEGFERKFEEYTEKDAIELGLNVKECSQPNSQEKYLTLQERVELYKK